LDRGVIVLRTRPGKSDDIHPFIVEDDF